jgi:hypothetical protein
LWVRGEIGVHSHVVILSLASRVRFVMRRNV